MKYHSEVRCLVKVRPLSRVLCPISVALEAQSQRWELESSEKPLRSR